MVVKMEKKLHVTIQRGQSLLLLEKCVQCCTLYHCPFCKPKVFKPTVHSKLLKHLEAHKNRAVQYKEYTIYKCNLDCKPQPHFHCAGCLSLFEKKKRIMEHMLKCEGTLNAEGDNVSEDEAECHPVSEDEMECHPVSEDEAGGHPVLEGNVTIAHKVPQVTRHKANQKKAEVRKTGKGPETPAFTLAEELGLQHNANRPLVEGIPGGTCSEPLAGCSSSYIGVTGHYITLLPPLERDSDDHSHCETRSTDSHLDEDSDPSSSQERANSAAGATGGSCREGPTGNIKALYRRYLKKEMENRDQEMAYRALKMRKLGKEIVLLDKHLDKQ
ncbi:hypothetical protein SKAU_G00326730 [Synaphobranchus kaupii]|uniref:Uncharacterized protein n=1 Tax=Synaphobranchus kaupii TaxID=118154 RepID=A0A9Q1EPV6_SYNKA|nr:hypothetical protein SKAU_G00326730 [Synaphobranchus kaupii]